MFARTNNALPAETPYPADLVDLGYKITENGQIVSITSPHLFSRAFVSDDERTNALYRSAINECVREEVDRQLAGLGVKKLYLSGANGAKISDHAPSGDSHLPIYATRDLAVKKDVVIVIGEQNQDPGIFAYRSVLNKGGIDGGSAVGLVKKLRELHLDAGTTSPRKHSKVTEDFTTTPGIIILNPGQRFFSHIENAPMTMASWDARPRKEGQITSYSVLDANRIQGHNDAQEHVATVFEHVIPKLVTPGARLWVVGIISGAEHFMTWMDRNLVNDPEKSIPNAVAAMAFMNPSVASNEILCPSFASDLASSGRSWIKSNEQKSTLVKTKNSGERTTADKASTMLEPSSEIGTNIDGNYSDVGNTPDDHSEAVFCPTYSAGTEIEELIFPTVVDDVLDWFKEKASKMSEREGGKEEFKVDYWKQQVEFLA